jgi:hypothetical protein
MADHPCGVRFRFCVLRQSDGEKDNSFQWSSGNDDKGDRIAGIQAFAF